MEISVKEKKELIFTYSAIEQKRHGILSPGKSLVVFMGIFPFIPLLLELFSCFVIYLGNRQFKISMFGLTSILALWLFVQIFLFVKRIFYVLIIDENGILYRLKISNFWYKIKNQTALLNPFGTSGGKFLKIFYMINNIKLVLQNISETITYEELISMGKLEKFTDISEVVIDKKNIVFNSKVKSASGEIKKRIKISRVYENDFQIINYLQGKDYLKTESMTEIVKELNKPKAKSVQIVRFSIKWISVMAWIAVILLSRDLGRLSKINEGIYEKKVIEIVSDDDIVEETVYMSNSGEYFKKSEYGNLYRPVIVVFLSVEIIYIISKVSDILIEKFKTNPSL